MTTPNAEKPKFNWWIIIAIVAVPLLYKSCSLEGGRGQSETPEYRALTGI